MSIRKIKNNEDASNWDRILSFSIEDIQLKAWVAKVIWWDICKYYETEDWELFYEKYDKIYNRKHTFTQNELLKTLDMIGYKFTSNMMRIPLKFKNLKRALPNIYKY